MTTLQEAARKALYALEASIDGDHPYYEDQLTAIESLRTALAQQELPQKERPDFMAGYDAGMADAKRMAQQGEQQPVSWRDEIKVLADVYAAKVSEFARSLALAKEDDSMSPVSAAAGDARMALHEAIDTHAERIKELEAVNKLLSGIQENTEEENDTLRAQLSAIAATEPTGWQKIETAKPTGTVLLTGPRGSHLGQWGSFVRYNHPKFTHWMPLPAAPKDTP